MIWKYNIITIDRLVLCLVSFRILLTFLTFTFIRFKPQYCVIMLYKQYICLSNIVFYHQELLGLIPSQDLALFHHFIIILSFVCNQPKLPKMSYHKTKKEYYFNLFYIFSCYFPVITEYLLQEHSYKGRIFCRSSGTLVLMLQLFFIYLYSTSSGNNSFFELQLINTWVLLKRKERSIRICWLLSRL